ncbi:MAG: hypothetical protein ACREMD_07205, partial [Gemmatimonadota bacterium]
MSAIVTIALAVACTRPSERPDEPSGEGDGVPSLSVREAWRSSPDLLLSRVIDLAVDSQGRVYLSDENAGILLLDSQGRLLRNVGRKGEGPGEYRSPSSLRTSPGDSLLLY